MRWLCGTAMVLALACSSLAAAQTVNLSGLSDLTLANLDPLQDHARAQGICVYSDAPGNGYMIAASGSGSGGGFVLDGGGSNQLAYSVEWSDRPGATSGTALSPGLALAFQSSGATEETCATGGPVSASLILRLSRLDLSAARASVTYSGTLSLTISPQ